MADILEKQRKMHNLIVVINRKAGNLLVANFCMIAVLLMLPSVVFAQAALRLSAPDISQYPLIQLPFDIIDNTSSTDTIRADTVFVFENGTPVFPVEVECGGFSSASQITFVFLMDVSFSMGFREDTTLYDPDSIKWRTAKRVFDDAYAMLRLQDEAALASFASDFYLEQFFTSNKTALSDATRRMMLRSGTAIYDAIAHSISLLQQRQGKRVIILLTDGADNSSRYTLEQAKQMAWNAGFPVYAIGLGLYQDPRDPFRKDQDTLRILAEGSGGQAYFSSKSEDLAGIFNQIIKGVYTVSCVARYISPDTCSDGNIRTISMKAAVKGVMAEATETYARPDLRSRLTITAAFPAELVYERLYNVPFTVNGELRSGEPLHAELLLRYDPGHFEFQGLDPLPGLLNPEDISVQENGPGELLFSVSGAIPTSGLPYGKTDTLCVLRFYVPRQDTLAVGMSSLTVSMLSQHCSIIGQGSERTWRIQGCPTTLYLTLDSAIIVASGEELLLPVVLQPELDIHQALSTVFSLEYGEELSYLGFQTNGTILENAIISEKHDSGLITFEAHTVTPALRSGILLFARFRAQSFKSGIRTRLHVIASQFTQYPSDSPSSLCTPVIFTSGAEVWIDGVCSPLVRRKLRPAVLAVYPQPVQSNDMYVGIDYVVADDQIVQLTAVNAYGIPTAVIAESRFSEGMHTIRWPITFLPSGVYFITLRQGNIIDSKKILITR